MIINTKYKKYNNFVLKIKKNKEYYKKMSDFELKKQTKIFRQRILKGEEIETILPEAYAVVIEANKRVLGLEAYDVQILGAVILFFGNIAEMKTGEGKTLTATMPMYLRGLMGPGNFVVTSNEYLAWRDAEDVGRVYSWLGLSVTVGVKKTEFDREPDKQIVYSADIVYTTHSALGFDYLLDNLATEQSNQFIKGFNFVVIDEIDSILLDMAQTPLIISGAPKLQSNLYKIVDKFVKSLRFGSDYDISEDKKSVWFLKEGIKNAEEYFSVKEILGKENKHLYRHMVLALRANCVYRKDRDYVVSDNEIFLLDEMNGRKLVGTKLQGGMHQALEAKEQIEITEETKAIGSITYQNLFKMFNVLSGMSGTAMTDAEEMRETYDVDVLRVPTHKPIRRKDHDLKIFTTHKEKILSSLELVKKSHETQRPILIATGSVSKSILYSKLLLDQRIPHSILNASTVYKEKPIIELAGKRGSVTVATSMAGRGTDIKLDKFSKENGGLIVIGTEAMGSERVDNQLRGRAGRQGEHGDTYFFSSLEDKIVVENAPKWVKKYRKKQESLYVDSKNQLGELKNNRFKKLIIKSQKSKKNQDVKSRRETLDYDDIVNVIRNRIYSIRNDVLSNKIEVLEKFIEKSLSEIVNDFVNTKENYKFDKVIDFVVNNIDYSFDRRDLKDSGTEFLNKTDLKNFLENKISKQVINLQKELDTPSEFNYYKQLIILKSLDTFWIELSDAFVQLKLIVKNRTWAQHQPLHEFEKESNRYYIEATNSLWKNIAKKFLLSELFVNEDGSIDIEFP